MHLSIVAIVSSTKKTHGPDISLDFDARDVIYTTIDGVLSREMKIAARQLERFVSTWNHDVYFDMDTYHDGDTYGISVSTDDEIFYFIDQGTQVRYATMTEDFIPKTSYRNYHSGYGRGGVQFINVRKPQNGIAAREIIDHVYENREAKFKRNMDRAIERALKKLWSKFV